MVEEASTIWPNIPIFHYLNDLGSGDHGEDKMHPELRQTTPWGGIHRRYDWGIKTCLDREKDKHVVEYIERGTKDGSFN